MNLKVSEVSDGALICGIIQVDKGKVSPLQALVWPTGWVEL